MTVYSVIIRFTVLWFLSLKCHFSVICKYPFCRLEKSFLDCYFFTSFPSCQCAACAYVPSPVYLYFALWFNINVHVSFSIDLSWALAIASVS